MPYLNKRNRFIQAAKQFADNATNGVSADYSQFTKTELLTISQSIGMKGIPTWVLKECRSTVSKGVFDMTSLIKSVPVTA